MEDQMKIYDTISDNKTFMYYNNGFNTTNCAKLKKSNNWTNIFTWKKKTKQSPNSIIDYPFVANNGRHVTGQRFGGSMSAATGIAYAYAPPPGRLPPSITPTPVACYARHDMRQELIASTTTTTTTTLHASIRGSVGNRHNRNSLFYTPWESFRDQTVSHMSDDCTCHSKAIVDNETYRSAAAPDGRQTVSAITSEPLYDSRRLSRMDLYSLDEENSYDKHMEFKSKSSDSLFGTTKRRPSNGLKSSRSSTTLSGSPFAYKASKTKDMTTSATVNERFLRFFKKSTSDPYNSIASRKSILECDVSAYDLIQQRLASEVLDEDIDDSLSDNAVENENSVHCVGKVGTAAPLNRKSHIVKSGLESRHSALPANSVRIGGIGMNLLPAPKLKTHQNSTNIYSTLDSSSETPTPNSWHTITPGLSEDGYPVPEPDYDIDDSDCDAYSSAQTPNQSFQGLKLSYSPPLATKRIDKQLLKAKQNSIITEINDTIDDNGVESDSHRVNGQTEQSSVRQTESRSPPPPPEPPALTQRLIHVTKVESKNSSLTSNVSSLQNELKGRLETGVKSILKKSPIIKSQLSTPLSKSESDITVMNSPSESCDYLKTFKEFKESRLRSGRHRRHVHFKSQSHDRLIIDQISAQTILEVEESDEPIYDDVQLPGATSPADDSCAGDQSTDDSANDCRESQLNAISTNDNEMTKCVSNDHCLDESLMRATAPAVLERQVHFNEFDPSEDLSSSSAARAQAVQCRTYGLDLKAKHNSLTEGHNSLGSNKNLNYSNNSIDSDVVNHELRASVGSPKSVLPLPVASARKCDSSTTGAERKLSLDDELRAPVVERKYMPFTRQTKSMTSAAKPSEEQMSAKQDNGRVAGAPQAPARAKSSPNSAGLTDRSYLSQKELKNKTNATSDQKYYEKKCMQSLPSLPVCREKCDLNQNNNNNNVLYDMKLEKQITNNKEMAILSHTSQCLTELTANDRPNNVKPMEECIESNSKANPYLCTISIKNGSDNSVINQTCIETNVNSICLNANSMPFESIGSSNSSSSLYSGPQSSTDSLHNHTERTQLLITKSSIDSPIPVFYANPNDKIVINVSSDKAFEQIEEHIYEELDTESIYIDTDGSLDNAKSIFDGASKDEILEFLEDAKERVGEDILVDQNIDTNIEILEAIDVIEEFPILSIGENALKNIETTIGSSNRRNRTSNVSNSSTDSTATTTSSSIDIEEDILKCAITNSASVGQLVERNDSGVGAETSKPSRLRKLSLNDEVEHQCADCEMHVDPNEDDVTGLLHYPLFCHRCDKKRSERKEIISEIVDTEFKYGRDLRIIREEFYRPIEIAGLLSKEQLKGVFLNLDDLIAVNSKFSEKLQDAIDIATEQGDEDFTTVNIGKLFRDSSSMLHTFEVYCVRQGSGALLLNHLEKEKELLRIFLRVSQMENTLLRRMNLRSFLVVPVQRVTKYPLLLNRLYKVTPYNHRDREALRDSQQKVELHLEHINQQTKGTIGATTRIWRRISNLSTSHRRLNNVDDIGNIKIRKTALEILKWTQEETQFVIIGKVLFAPITDYTINRRTKTLKFLTASALLVTLGRPNQNYRPDLVNNSDVSKDMVFPRDNTGITDAVLLLIKEKCGRYALQKEILNLKSCVISSETENDEMFEIHEQMTKESLLFKAESLNETKDWLKQLKYHSKDLGNWRRRRNALANIMMVRQ